jgi:hypothetical protein
MPLPDGVRRRTDGIVGFEPVTYECDQCLSACEASDLSDGGGQLLGNYCSTCLPLMLGNAVTNSAVCKPALAKAVIPMAKLGRKAAIQGDDQ